MCYGRSARLTRKARRFALEPHGGGTGTRKSTLGIGDLAARTPSRARCCALPHRTWFARRSATNSSSASRADRDRVAAGECLFPLSCGRTVPNTGYGLAAVALSYANRSGRKWPEKPARVGVDVDQRQPRKGSVLQQEPVISVLNELGGSIAFLGWCAAPFRSTPQPGLRHVTP